MFDRYIALDWSASNRPKLGRDSIWSGDASARGSAVEATNHPTRRAAAVWLQGQLITATAAGQRVLVGADFAYGYPAGFARALGVDGWGGVWAYLAQRIRDSELNQSNRFEVAAQINRRLGADAPFWGRPAHLDLPGLPPRKVIAYRGPAQGGQSEWRRVDEHVRSRHRGLQPVWKLAYAGSVGSQSLVGIPVLHRLRVHVALRDVSRVWPFEIGVPELPVGVSAIIHAEVWPSLVAFGAEGGSCRDEQQVRALVRHWRTLDRHGGLAELFAAAPGTAAVRGEEGWILGAVQTARGG